MLRCAAPMDSMATFATRQSRSAVGGRVFWLLALLLCVAAFVRYRALAFGLPHTQARPDETVIIEASRSLLSGRLPHFYDYPWLYIWFVSAAYIGYALLGAIAGAFHSVGDMVASWPVHWEPFFLISRAISAAFGTISILLAYRLGRQIRDERTGIVAALFLAFAFIHVRDSHFGTTDIAMTFFILCAVSLLIDGHQTGLARTFAAAGAMAGLAAATKYNAVLLVVPVIVSVIMSAAEPARAGAARPVERLLNFGIPFLLVFFAGVPFVILDRARFLEAMATLVHSMEIGDPRLGLSNGWLHHLQFSLRYGLGMPLLVAGLAGAAVLLWTEPRRAALLLAFPVAYYVVAGSIRNLFFRYTMPIVPFLCITAAFLVCAIVTALVDRMAAGRPRRDAILNGALAALSIAIVIPSAVSIWQLDRVLAATDNRVVVARWFAQNVPPGSSVLQSGSRYGLVQFDRHLGYREWRWDGPRRIFLVDGERPSGRPDWILLQESPLPSTTQPIVNEMLKERYVLVSRFPALSIDEGLVYDRQDAFFVPFKGFNRVERPGPNFSVFRREPGHDRDARAALR